MSIIFDGEKKNANAMKICFIYSHKIRIMAHGKLVKRKREIKMMVI